MGAKAILSSKGQLVIPKNLRQKMGLRCGSELILELTSNNNLEISQAKQSISKFFGMGKRNVNGPVISVEEIDQAIGEAIIKNDRN